MIFDDLECASAGGSCVAEARLESAAAAVVVDIGRVAVRLR